MHCPAPWRADWGLIRTHTEIEFNSHCFAQTFHQSWASTLDSLKRGHYSASDFSNYQALWAQDEDGYSLQCRHSGFCMSRSEGGLGHAMPILRAKPYWLPLYHSVYWLKLPCLWLSPLICKMSRIIVSTRRLLQQFNWVYTCKQKQQQKKNTASSS